MVVNRGHLGGVNFNYVSLIHWLARVKMVLALRNKSLTDKEFQITSLCGTKMWYEI